MQWLVAWVVVVLALGARGAAEYNLAGQPGKGYIVEVMLGHPGQKLNVLIDTGSSNFAVAAAPNANINAVFHPANSTTFQDLTTPVSVLYTQGRWSGQLASDYVYFPTLNSVPEVRCDFAVITESSNLYMNGSNWQGILGLAYPAILKPDSTVVTWLDSLQKTNKDRTIAFSLTLCGARDPYHIDHYGSFEILNNVVQNMDGLLTTPVIREWFYEVVLTGFDVGGTPVDVECAYLNGERTIVDSGTTNIRLPSVVFDKAVELIRREASSWGAPDLFWSGAQACWSRPRRPDDLPWLALHLARGPDQEIVLHLPPESYIRQTGASPSNAAYEPQFCYNFGLEASSGVVVLGVAALEGFEVIFNRTGRTVGFRPSQCGPNVSISGPYKSVLSDDLLRYCSHGLSGPLTMLEMAAYIVSAVLIVATIMFVYLLAQWLRDKYLRCHVAATSVSLSHTSLINEEP